MFSTSLQAESLHGDTEQGTVKCEMSAGGSQLREDTSRAERGYPKPASCAEDTDNLPLCKDFPEQKLSNFGVRTSRLETTCINVVCDSAYVDLSF